MTPGMWARLIGAVLLGGVLLFSFNTIKGWKDDAEKYKGLSEQQTATAEATSTITGSVDTALTAGTTQAAEVSAHRVAREARFEEMKNADPDTRAWADSRIPQWLRDDERAARLARDRPGGDAPGGEAPDGEASGRGRDPAP